MAEIKEGPWQAEQKAESIRSQIKALEDELTKMLHDGDLGEHGTDPHQAKAAKIRQQIGNLQDMLPKTGK